MSDVFSSVDALRLPMMTPDNQSVRGTAFTVSIDARQGVIEQTRRHAFIASMLRIPHLVVCINKMDLVNYSEETFGAIRSSFMDFATKLQIKDITFIPISALNGDNIVDKSDKMPWFLGAPLLRHLEEVYIGTDRDLDDPRFPVQYVIRPNLDFRGFSGFISGGNIRPGDIVRILPSGRDTRVARVVTYDGDLDSAVSGQSVTLTLAEFVELPAAS